MVVVIFVKVMLDVVVCVLLLMGEDCIVDIIEWMVLIEVLLFDFMVVIEESLCCEVLVKVGNNVEVEVEK